MSGRWHTVEIGPDSYLVEDGRDRIVGAIMREAGMFRAVIIWGGATNNIAGDFAAYNCALAFVEGVEKTFLAIDEVTP